MYLAHSTQQCSSNEQLTRQCSENAGYSTILSVIQQTPSVVLLFLRLCYSVTRAEAMKGSPSRAMSWLGDRQITDNGKDSAKEKRNKCNKLRREGGPLSLIVNKGFLN